MSRTNVSPLPGFHPIDPQMVQYAEFTVASGYATDIVIGDPVVATASGVVQRTPAGSAAGAATDGLTGIVTNVIQYKDSTGNVRRTGARYVPASTTWTTQGERTIVQVALCTTSTIFRAHAVGTAASLAAAISQNFANADHSYTGANLTLGLSGAKLNLGTLGTTATLQWRVLWDDRAVAANDFTATGFMIHCTPNLIYGLPVVGGSTTGL